MREWFPASELAELCLPGLPKRQDNIARKATREGWKSREVPTPGGGPMRREIHISSLPPETRDALETRLLESSPGRIEAERIKLAARMEERARQARVQAGMAEAAKLQDEARRRMEARLEVVTWFREMQRDTGLPIYKVADTLVTLYNSRKIDGISAATYAEIGQVSVSSIKRWDRTLREHGASALAGRYGTRSKREYKSLIDTDEDVRAVVLGVIKDNPHAKSRHVLRALRARFNAERVPSHRTVQRYIKDWSERNAQLKTYIKNPDAWRSLYRTAYGTASEQIIRLNQLWELDSTPADVMLKDGRHAIIGMIDVYTRQARLHVARTSSSAGIISLLRRTILEMGMPEAVGTDQGKDYLSKAVRRVLPALGIEHLEMPPFSPEKKPFIERFFRTFSHDMVELLPGFIGHNVADRQAIEARRSFADRLMKGGDAIEIEMDAEELQAFCDEWVRDVYAHEPHGGLNGRTPYQMAAGQSVHKIENERALDLLLAPAPGGDGMRTVTKKGIRINGLHFIAPELGAYAGQQVLCLYDEADAGRVYVFGGADVDFLCIAECPDITGVSRQELAIEARKYQQRVLAEQKKELDAAARKASTGEIWREIMAAKREEASVMRRIDGPTASYTTDALDAASAAADARDAMDAPRELRRENAPEVEARIKRLEAADRARGEIVRPRFWDDEAHRFRWVKEAALAGKGALITEADWDFYHDFADELGLGPEDRVMQRKQAK